MNLWIYWLSLWVINVVFAYKYYLRGFISTFEEYVQIQLNREILIV